MNAERDKRHFKALTITFWIYVSCFLFAYIFAVLDEKLQAVQVLQGAWALVWLASGIYYLYLVFSLSRAAYRSPVMWVGLTFIFGPFGVIGSFIMMKKVAKHNQWL